MTSLPPSLVEAVALLTAKMFDLQSATAKESGFTDLSLRQITYLDRIQHLGNPTPTELARAFQVSKPTISIALDRLEEAGYVRKSQSDEDRRSYHIHLTEKGEAFTIVHHQVHQELAQLLAQSLDAAEVEQLHRLLLKILANLQSPPTQEEP